MKYKGKQRAKRRLFLETKTEVSEKYEDGNDT